MTISSFFLQGDYSDEDEVTMLSKPERQISLTYRPSVSMPVLVPSGLLPAYLDEVCSIRDAVCMEPVTEGDYDFIHIIFNWSLQLVHCFRWLT